MIAPLVPNLEALCAINNMPPVVPKADLAAADQIAASLFFESVFGKAGGANGLNFLIALSAFGNLLAVFLGQSRLLRECGRYAQPFVREE